MHRLAFAALALILTSPALAISAALIIGALAATPAAANDMESCRTGALKDRIAPCTRAIASRKYKGEDLAILYSERGTANSSVSYDLAIADYTEALRIRPKDNVWAHLSIYQLRGEIHSFKGEYDRAIADFTQALRTRPSEYLIKRSVYYSRAAAYKVKGDLDRAIADYGQVIDLDPTFLNSFYKRGTLYYKTGNLDRAISDYDNAIVRKPKMAEAYAGRALAYQKKGDVLRARDDFAAALEHRTPDSEHDGQSVTDIVERGLATLTGPAIPPPTVATTQGPAATPSAATPSAAKSDAGDSEACTTGRTYKGKDAIVAACSRLIASGTVHGQDLVGLYNIRGFTYWFFDDFDPALADFNEIIRLDPNNQDGYFYRGLIRSRTDNARAIADFSEALRIGPFYYPSYNQRGYIYLKMGDYDRAIADFSESIRLNPKFVFSFTSRGEAYEKKGDLENALADFDMALTLEPNRADATTAIARINARAPGLSVVEKPVVSEPAALQPASVPQQSAALLPSPLPAEAKPAPSAPARPTVTALAPPAPNPAAQPPAALDRRIALVIGNSAYISFPKIPNPRNDAEDLEKSLKNLGFEVLLGLDLKRADMEDILALFARRARQADTALVFFAGHGLQHNGINYLAPVDGRIEDETDLRKLINLQDVISDLQNAGRVRILIVDACRDNQVLQQLASRLPATRTAAFTRGLARIEGADGTLIAFATQPNRLANDGDGRNSPFTQALLKHLPTPGLELRTLMTRVRSEVVNATGRTQRPEVWDSLVGEVVFRNTE
jgi:tetratricopeptide (TPR) repeat protein